MATLLEIYRVGNDEPIRYAAAQLKHYLKRATRASVRVRARKSHDSSVSGLWLGTSRALGRADDMASDEDAVDISVGSIGGVIAGSNPRSVLLSTYRYLTEIGFRWVRPGRDGELVPSLKTPLRKRVSLRQRASHGHRVICIEGASSYQHVYDLIDWMPKLGFNGYFVQFRDAYNFFDRWYRHELNPRLAKKRFTVRDARQATQKIWAQCRRRGLKIQMVGHGWTCDPFGVTGHGWYQHSGPIPRSIKPHLAKVNGQRTFWGGVPLNTNLCYGNSATRKVMIRAVADYATTHPDVDAVHLWLADGYNNHCECRRCRRHRPADLYIRLLNEVDAELTRRNLSTRIVFLIYQDLLWPPRSARIANPDRFILMFAPITRTYSQSLAGAVKVRSKIPPYVRNKLTMPNRIEDNLAFLRAWQRVFKGDSFNFDYHLMWDHFKDPGHYDLARVMHKDIRSLRDLGINGFNSCQVQRCFLPSGLIMTVLGRTLWDRDLTFDAIANDHYRAAFGTDWQKVKRYVQRIGKLFDPPYLRHERDDAGRKRTAAMVAQIPSAINRFMPVIKANLDIADRCQARSWYYLKEHAELMTTMSEAMAAAIRGDEDASRQTAHHMVETARRKEPRIHKVFDVHTFIHTIGRPLGWNEEGDR